MFIKIKTAIDAWREFFPGVYRMLRKILCVAVSLLLISVLLVSFGFADTVKEMIEVYRNHVTIEVDGEKVNVDNFIYDDTTYAPLRAVAEMLNKDVAAKINLARDYGIGGISLWRIGNIPSFYSEQDLDFDVWQYIISECWD